MGSVAKPWLTGQCLRATALKGGEGEHIPAFVIYCAVISYVADRGGRTHAAYFVLSCDSS